MAEGYTLNGLNEHSAGSNGTLSLLGSGPFGSDISLAEFSVEYVSNAIARLRITDPKEQRYEVPLVMEQLPKQQTQDDRLYDLELQHSPFGVQMKRKATGRTLFDTSTDFAAAIEGLSFENQFLSLSFRVPDDSVLFGLGQHYNTVNLENDADDTQIFTAFARDQGTNFHTAEGGKNLYGTHPFLMALSPTTGNTFGIFFLNSNPMDFVIRKSPHSVTFRSIGGIFDFFFFVGPSPMEVLQQYYTVIGKPFLPPYWALGFHLCRWGYDSLADVKSNVEKMRQGGFPQDTQWVDIDHMDNHLDFTISDKFAGLGEYVDTLHSSGMKFVMIVDPGISNQYDNYSVYTDGLKQDVYMKEPNGKPSHGVVWPGETVFPDFFYEPTVSWWTDAFSAFHEILPFDGVWIDMNECSNFCDGDCTTPDAAPQSGGRFPFNPTHPPYVPGKRGSGWELNHRTLDFAALHHGGLRSYDTHSMYGFSEIRATNMALDTLFRHKRRPMIISRASYSGSGRYGSTWLGDNFSTWAYLRVSIPTILANGLFGLPFTGPDVCGFNGNSTEELCTRFMQVGAFFPFYRNHNSIGMKEQQPYVWGDSAQTVIRKAMLARYHLLPYLYTVTVDSHLVGSPIARPLWLEFPSDPKAALVEYQFLLGGALLVTPVLEQAATSVSGYFPASRWFCWWSGIELAQTAIPGEIELDAPLDFIAVHQRGGEVVAGQAPALNTASSRQNPLDFTVAPDFNGHSSGSVYFDDGESPDAATDMMYDRIGLNCTVVAGGGVLELSHDVTGYADALALPIGSLRVFGAERGSYSVLVNGAQSGSARYDDSTKVLTVQLSDAALGSTKRIEWRRNG